MNNKAYIKSIEHALHQDVHQQLNVLNSIILNMFSYFVLNKITTIRDPPWMSKFIKSKIH